MTPRPGRISPQMPAPEVDASARGFGRIFFVNAKLSNEKNRKVGWVI